MKHVKPQSALPALAQEDPCVELSGKDLCKCEKEQGKGSKKEPQ